MQDAVFQLLQMVRVSNRLVNEVAKPSIEFNITTLVTVVVVRLKFVLVVDTWENTGGWKVPDMRGRDSRRVLHKSR